jgi:hypothetical protein
MEWRKPSYCESNSCVEVAVAGEGGMILVRDSDDPSSVLTVRPAAWEAFIEGVKAGEFDR